jgi:MbtH protein
MPVASCRHGPPAHAHREAVLRSSVTLKGGATMSQDDREDTTTYQVVVNHEEQYSIWPADRELPLGWTQVGTIGPKQECLDYIKDVWTDMRPLSLRKKMEAIERERK